MEPQLLLKTATALFAIAALGGATMAVIVKTRKVNPPPWLAMLHGLLASAGLTLLAFAAFTATIPAFAIYALVLFAAAALGGLVLNLGYQWRGLPIPIGLMLAHALVAVGGFVLLLIAVSGPSATA